MSSEEEPKVVRKSTDAPITEDWVLDSEEENASQTKTQKKTVKPSIARTEFVKPKQQERTARKTVKQVEKHKQNTHSPRGNQRNWNNMMSQRLGSNFEMFNKALNAARPMSYLSKKAHSSVKRPFHINTAFKNSNFNQRVNTIKDKSVNIVRPKEVVNAARLKAVVNADKGNNFNAVKAS
ncbi:hypothetical protein Tco_0159611, partial [Tanacetum coccineum]